MSSTLKNTLIVIVPQFQIHRNNEEIYTSNLRTDIVDCFVPCAPDKRLENEPLCVHTWKGKDTNQVQ
jgi:hypothetical protein